CGPESSLRSWHDEQSGLVSRAVMHAAAHPHYNTVKSAYGVKSDGCLIETTVLRCALSRLCGALQPWAEPGFRRFYDPFQGARAQTRGFAPQKLRRVGGWRVTNAGSYPVIDTKVVEPSSREAMGQTLARVGHCIARGAGNSIGDGAMNNELVVSTRGLARMLAFDEETGLLVAEAGVTLADVATSFATRGWFLPTTPGTNQISLGGAVASDVHGKNHHVVGSFARHVHWIEVLTAEQGIVLCSPTQHQDLFHATCGGIGLTGIVLTVAVQLMRIPSNWIRQIGVKTRSLLDTLEACETYSNYTYSVAWIDPHARGAAMGRGYLMCGEFAEAQELGSKNVAASAAGGRDDGFKIPAYFPVPLLKLRLFSRSSGQETSHSRWKALTLGSTLRSHPACSSFSANLTLWCSTMAAVTI
ncbi:MAG: FAD-binding oxidoreductase, partial [Zymomonas sp.]